DFAEPIPLTTMFGWYPSLTGMFAVATFAMHGSIYLYLKTEGELHQRVRGWMWRSFFVFLTLYVLVSLATLLGLPRATDKYRDYPWLLIMPVLNILAIANIPRAIAQERPYYAFLSSACTIAAFTFLFGMTLYPNIIVSNIDPEYSLTVARA